MGYDIFAYLPVDRDKIEDFIKLNNINIKDYDECKIIAKHFYKEISGLECENDQCPVMYYYSKTKDRHVLFESHGCNYIRKHKRLNEENSNLPYCITDCLYYIDTPKSAVEVANGLRKYLLDDEDLMYFAEWLEKTSAYCVSYQLDY